MITPIFAPGMVLNIGKKKLVTIASIVDNPWGSQTKYCTRYYTLINNDTHHFREDYLIELIIRHNSLKPILSIKTN